MNRHPGKTGALTAHGTKYFDETPEDVVGGPGLRAVSEVRRNAIVNIDINNFTTLNSRS